MRVVSRAKSVSTRLPSFPRHLLSVICLGSAGVHAQEALRTALEADRALDTRQTYPGWTTEGPQAGPIQFEFGAGFSAEWDSNVNLSEDDPRHDIALRPQANLRALWPVTDQTRLTLGAGLGYTFYVEGNRENRLLVSPDSAFFFDIGIGDVVLTVYDQVDYSDDLTAEGGLTNVSGDYARISNTAGLRAAWYVLDWRFQAGYAHYNYWSLAEEYRDLDRGSEQLFARVGYLLAAETEVGVETSASITDYTETLRSDFHSVSLGPYVEWRFTDALITRLRGGYVVYDFDDSPTGPSLGTLNSYYLGLTAEHQLTDFLTHQLSATQKVRVGTSSEYEEQFQASYGLRWALFEALSASTGLFYEYTLAPQPLQDERYHRLGFNLGTNLRLTDNLSTGLSYRFTVRDSDLASRDYTQHLVMLNLGYQF